MRILMLSLMAGPEGARHPGKEYDVEAEMAFALRDAGAAKLLDPIECTEASDPAGPPLEDAVQDSKPDPEPETETQPETPAEDNAGGSTPENTSIAPTETATGPGQKSRGRRRSS